MVQNTGPVRPALSSSEPTRLATGSGWALASGTLQVANGVRNSWANRRRNQEGAEGQEDRELCSTSAS